MNASLAALAYLVSGVLFILSLRGLSSPETSRQGNTFGMIGMALAIGVTLLTLGTTGALDTVTLALGQVATLDLDVGGAAVVADGTTVDDIVATAKLLLAPSASVKA